MSSLTQVSKSFFLFCLGLFLPGWDLGLLRKEDLDFGANNQKLDRGSIRSSPRNGIEPISNKN